MDALFENYYKRTKDVHRQIISYIFFRRPAAIAMIFALFCIFAYCVLSLFIPGKYSIGDTALMYIIIIIAAAAVKILRYLRTLGMSYKRDLENNGGEIADIRLVATGEGIEVFRSNTESSTQYSYRSVRKVIPTRCFYLLSTEAKQYIVFKKDGFVKGSPEEFLPFIKKMIERKPGPAPE